MFVKRSMLLVAVLFLCSFAIAQAASHIVDISHYSGKIDWKKAKRAGVSMVFIKSSEGSSLTDPAFAKNYRGANEQVIAVVPYHVFSYTSSPQKQLNQLLAVLKANHVTGKTIAVDFSSDYRKSQYNAKSINKFLSLLLAHHLQPIIYVEKGRLFLVKAIHHYKNYSLWLGYSQHFCSFSWEQLDILRHAHIAYTQYPVNQKVSWASGKVDFNRKGDPRQICGKKWLKF